MGNKFLNLIYPFICIYLAVILFYSYYMGNTSNGGLLDLIILITITVLIMFAVYGLLSFLKDIKEDGSLTTINYWIRKIFH